MAPRVTVTVRPATIDDADLLLEWSNDPDTRAASFRSDPISHATHLRWLDGRLADPNARIFVGLAEDGRPIGVVRFERLALGGPAEVGISVAPRARGLGRSVPLLRAGLEAARRELAPTGFVAHIRPDNTRSIALFSRAGFVRVGEVDVAGHQALEFRL